MGQYNRNDPFMTFLCIQTGDNYNNSYCQDTFRELRDNNAEFWINKYKYSLS